jgi:hypothetical protein
MANFLIQSNPIDGVNFKTIERALDRAKIFHGAHLISIK